MAFEEAIGQLLEAKAKKTEKMIITAGVVQAVGEHDCDIQRQGMPDLLGVRFMATIKDQDNYFKITPSIGSTVLCGIIENDISEAVILAYSEIDKVEIAIDTAEFLMQGGKFTIKNDNADIKEVLTDAFDQLINAKILTPSGTGIFSPDDKAAFTILKQKTTPVSYTHLTLPTIYSV